MTKACRECAAIFEFQFSELIAPFVQICPSCAEAQGQREIKAVLLACRSAQRRGWEELCHPAYLKTEPHKLPRPSLLDKVMQWQRGAKGLLLHGQTGLGKSRCLWKLAEREFKAGASIRALNCSSGAQFAACYAVSAASVTAWQDAVVRCDVLLVDDVFKAKLTDGFEAWLFAVIDRRIEAELPVFVALNDDEQTLLSRMSSDRGPALLRRFRDATTPILFSR